MFLKIFFAVLYTYLNWKCLLCFITDCTDKHHHSHAQTQHENDTTTNNNNNNNINNNNTTNVNNNRRQKRQYCVSTDGQTISEDDLDNLINQSINEWQQRQKNGEIDIDIDLNQTASIIS